MQHYPLLQFDKLEVLNHSLATSSTVLSEVDFYIENWTLMSDIILDLYSTSLEIGHIGDSQRKGLITLIPKSDSNRLHINNYRPISLLCADYKILAKILSERIKGVLHKVINNKQFCSVPGRTINQCNMEIRDIVNYAKYTNLDLGILNLDWYKAFDLVPVGFVFKILEKLGFGEQFIGCGWIKVFYVYWY